MNDTLKKYIKVSLTLGLIAGGSALLIGLTNSITATKIIQNDATKEANGLKSVFSDDSQTFDTIDVSADTYEYISKIWSVKSNSKDLGFVYKTSGKNSFGEVSLLLGFDTNKTFVNMVVLTNTETYGSTLEENYIDPVNSSTREFTDVSCGATYGAKLVRDMYLEAKADVEKR